MRKENQILWKVWYLNMPPSNTKVDDHVLLHQAIGKLWEGTCAQKGHVQIMLDKMQLENNMLNLYYGMAVWIEMAL